MASKQGGKKKGKKGKGKDQNKATPKPTDTKVKEEPKKVETPTKAEVAATPDTPEAKKTPRAPPNTVATPQPASPPPTSEPSTIPEKDDEDDDDKKATTKKNKNKKKKKKKKGGASTAPSATTPAASQPKDKDNKPKDKPVPAATERGRGGSVGGLPKGLDLTDAQLRQLRQYFEGGGDLKRLDRTFLKDTIRSSLDTVLKNVQGVAPTPIESTSKERAVRRDQWKQKYLDAAAEVNRLMKLRQPEAKEDSDRLYRDLVRLVEEHNPDPALAPTALQNAFYSASISLFQNRDAQYWRLVPHEGDWRIEIYTTGRPKIDIPEPLKPYEKKIKFFAGELPEIPL